MSRYEITMPIITALLVIAGLITLSTAAPPDTGSEFKRQLMWLGLATLACGVVIWLGQHRIMRYSFHAHYIAIFMLVLTYFFGEERNGARSWLELGPLPSFQPTEFAKITLILVLAVLFHERPITNLLHYVRPGLMILLPFGLIVLQPDLGSALVVLAIGVGVFIVRGIPWWHLVLIISLAIPLAIFVVWPHLENYQRERLVCFLDPHKVDREKNINRPQGCGYQIIQSEIAIGSGGVRGKGYHQGTQGQLGYIPERHNDFIFPVLAEEGGFVAASLLLALFGLLFWRLVAMAIECPKERDQLVIIGVLSFIGFQMIMNIGVTLRLAPVTGITLPLISYGGTSLLSTLVAITIAFVAHHDRYKEW